MVFNRLSTLGCHREWREISILFLPFNRNTLAFSKQSNWGREKWVDKCLYRENTWYLINTFSYWSSELQRNGLVYVHIWFDLICILGCTSLLVFETTRKKFSIWDRFKNFFLNTSHKLCRNICECGYEVSRYELSQYKMSWYEMSGCKMSFTYVLGLKVWQGGYSGMLVPQCLLSRYKGLLIFGYNLYAAVKSVT